MRKKIAVIGGGQIGQGVAMLASQKELGDITIVGLCQCGQGQGSRLDGNGAARQL
jgi:malate/lactate dehydrogenase